MSRFENIFCSPQTQQPKTYSNTVSYSTNIAKSHFSAQRNCRDKSWQLRSCLRGKFWRLLAKAPSNQPLKALLLEKYGRPRAQEMAAFARGCIIAKSPFSAQGKYRGKYWHLLAKDDSNLSRFR